MRAFAVVALMLLDAAAPGALAASPFDKRADDLTAQLRARAGKPEAIAPLAALIRLEEQLPPGRLAPLLREVVEAKNSHPLVAAQAAFYLATEDERRGDQELAGQRVKSLGFWSEFWVVGPFDAQGRSGLQRAYPPEQTAIDLRKEALFPGKERDVSWRKAP